MVEKKKELIEISFQRTGNLIDKAIDELIELASPIHHPEIIREMIITALKAGREEEIKADLKLMNNTLKEMRFTSKIFGPYRDIRKVTVFGSARTKPDEPVYEMARIFGKKLAEAGYMVITGGGPGIMQAVNEGAGPENSFGVTIRLPFEQKINPVVEGNPRLISYKYFFNRKIAFIKEASAVALFPGGFGTLDEAMETSMLLQTGKRYPIPLILIDEPEGTYWKKWLKFFEEELLSQNYITASDFCIFDRVTSVDEAVMKINHFYHRYHSMRYVNNKLVIRLISSISSKEIQMLKEKYNRILIPEGDIFLSGPFPEEFDEPEILHLPRLVLDFNRKNFVRLRCLIDDINNF
ncbi:MAG: TIGR00730 family Rossman fold protein [Thermodesulfovibrionales bacterium]